MGDGLNMGVYECDDGNLNSGDGCSDQGTVEAGYVCKGGTPSSADICSLPPALTRFTMDASSYSLAVQFSEPVNLESKPSAYNIDYSVDDISISFPEGSPSLGLKFSLALPSPAAYKDGVPLYTHFIIILEPQESVNPNKHVSIRENAIDNRGGSSERV